MNAGTVAPRPDPEQKSGSTLPPPEEAWAAIAARDRRYDGSFVYAVASTGVYCRPSCPSRRPRRDRVTLFAAAAEAGAAGYRACRRCQPDAQGLGEAAERIERARAFLEAHLDETVTLERLGREVGLSPWHLQRAFKRELGVTPRQYIDSRRLATVRARLKEGDTVIQATFEAGYGASSRLYAQAGPHLGMTPGAFRRGGQGMLIRFAIAASPLGLLLVGATERGLAAVMLGDDEDGLAEALRGQYPAASLQRADSDLSPWLAAVQGLLEARPLPGLSELPLDIQATAFERRVGQALRDIPLGATRSYSEIAQAIGQPAAVRAVARACATNPVAIVVPCHRVVRADGSPGGYRWGPERKTRLLEKERLAAVAGGREKPASPVRGRKAPAKR